MLPCQAPTAAVWLAGWPSSSPPSSPGCALMPQAAHACCAFMCFCTERPKLGARRKSALLLLQWLGDQTQLLVAAVFCIAELQDPNCAQGVARHCCCCSGLALKVSMHARRQSAAGCAAARACKQPPGIHIRSACKVACTCLDCSLSTTRSTNTLFTAACDDWRNELQCLCGSMHLLSFCTSLLSASVMPMLHVGISRASTAACSEFCMKLSAAVKACGPEDASAHVTLARRRTPQIAWPSWTRSSRSLASARATAATCQMVRAACALLCAVHACAHGLVHTCMAWHWLAGSRVVDMQQELVIVFNPASGL